MKEDSYVDPFEEFRRKKGPPGQPLEKGSETKPSLPPDALEGRPKGFQTHRFNFGIGPSQPDEEILKETQKPTGFSSHRLADPRETKEELKKEKVEKPKRFSLHRVGKSRYTEKQ